MKTIKRRLFIIVGLVVSASAEDRFPSIPVLNEEIAVAHAERMNYPLLGREHVAQGAVVVRAELRNDGSVLSASAVSGPKYLLEDSVKNAKSWRFSRIGRGVAFIVYLFKIEGLCELPCPSNFEFIPPNVVTISVGSPLATP